MTDIFHLFLYLATIEIQIDRDILITHRTDNGIFYKIGIQFGIQKDVLYRTGNILIFCTFHNGKLAVRYHFMLTVITEDDVPIHLIASHLCSNLNLRADVFADTSPFGMYHIMLVNKPVLLEWRINKTEKHPSLRFGSYHTIRPILPHHLINNVRIGIRKIKSIEAFLLFRNAQS